MIVPSQRWYLVAAALGLLALPALKWPGAAVILFAADGLWIAALLIDVGRLSRLDLGRLDVRREPPPAFSVGRTLPVGYRWRNPLRRPLLLRVREELPAPLEPVGERRLRLPPGGVLREEVPVRPVRRSKRTSSRPAAASRSSRARATLRWTPSAAAASSAVRSEELPRASKSASRRSGSA